MQWLDFLQYGSVVGLIVAGGFAGLQRGRIMNLREDNADLRGRRDDLEKDRDDLKQHLDAERKANAAIVAELKGKIDGAVRVLAETETAKDKIGGLAVQLAEHHEQSMAVLTTIAESLNRGRT